MTAALALALFVAHLWPFALVVALAALAFHLFTSDPARSIEHDVEAAIGPDVSEAVREAESLTVWAAIQRAVDEGGL